VATYKLIQNIEAEDKILGPLTLRQFIFALITAFFGYLCFICIAKEVYFLLILFAPPMLLAGFFAFPFGGDQPTEVWALAKLRFYFKPRKRIWDQSGIKEMVTITVPKKIERYYTDGLSQTEVQSRLKALASTIDSRGWAIKNINVNNYVPNPLSNQTTDRLLDISAVPNAVPETIVQERDDILDEQHNPIALQFDSMIAQSTQRYHEELVEKMNANTPVQSLQPQAGTPWFFMGNANTSSPQQVTNSSDDSALAAQIHAQSSSKRATYGNLRTLRPLVATATTPAAPVASDVNTPSTTVTAPPHPAILALANNDDLSVSTIAREAKKAKGNKSKDDEVVISLH
jgi:hypothetical protein